MTTWLVLLGAALATYLIRISMVVVFDRRELPTAMEPVLGLATPAVLAAVTASAMFLHGDSFDAPPLGPLVALAAAVVVVRRTRKPVLALVVGLPIAAVASFIGLG